MRLGCLKLISIFHLAKIAFSVVSAKALGEDGEEMKTATEWQTLESEDNFSKLNFSIRDEEPFPVA